MLHHQESNVREIPDSERPDIPNLHKKDVPKSGRGQASEGVAHGGQKDCDGNTYMQTV